MDEQDEVASDSGSVCDEAPGSDEAPLSDSDSDLDESFLAAAGSASYVRYTGAEWVANIPCRADLVAEGDCAAAQAALAPLARGAPVRFLPVDVEDSSEFERGGQYYALRLYGPMPDGSKACVTVTGIRPFFDVQLPAGAEPGAFEQLLRALLAESPPAICERVQAYPDHGYREAPVPFARLAFDNLPDRKRALESVAAAIADPGSPLRGAATKSDDRSSYYRKAARELGLPLSDWAVLSNYEHEAGPTARSPLCAHIFRVPAAGYRPLTDPLAGAAERAAAAAAAAADPLRELMARDRTLVLAWDIETHSGRGTGDVPAPEHAADEMFMAAITVHWKDDARALRRIVIVDVPSAPDTRWLTIECGSPANVLKAFVLCVRALAPDVMVGFNDSGYDWPFVIGKAARAGILGWLVHMLTAAPRARAPEEEAARRWSYRDSQKIKISAEETVLSSYLKVPGCVPIDARVCFKKLFPKSETSAAGSLKFYLQASGLPGKADMPIGKMWRHYEEAKKLTAAAASGAAASGAAASAATNMRAVAHYCVIDAERCQSLLVRRAVLGDYREVSTLAYVSLADAHYYAGGMKVCNLLGAYAWRRNILMSMRPSERESEGKYPGAYVFPPEKGIVPDPSRIAAFDQVAASGDAAAVIAAAATIASDRPVVGLDFSSLYPSLMMAYNFSRECYVATEAEAEALKGRGVDLHAVEFPYGGAQVRGWFVRHRNETAKIGLYPSVLIDLFAKRAEVKVVLGIHGATREQIGVVYARAAADNCSAAAAHARVLADAEAEAAAADARLAALAAGAAPSRGATVDEDRADAQRRRKQARAAAAELRRIEATGTDLSLSAAHAAAARETALADALAAEKARADFDYVCANAKQGAIKVYMNTFYGEAGNALSPLFLLPLAGGVTSAGKDNIQAVAEFVRARGFGLKYGDTDSLYLTCPTTHFAECDAAYAAALRAADAVAGGHKAVAGGHKAAREEWMSTQVRVTMRVMNLTRDTVNTFLRERSGGPYLKMAYEEVLFPVVFTGKKKYYGIPHVSEVNFRPRELFVRGIDVVKQGQPGLARELGYRIMWASVALDNSRVLLAIVRDALRDAVVNGAQWGFEHFVKTDAWKPLKNNVAVHRFIARMGARRAMLEAAGQSTALYALPEPGERFSYVIARTGEAFDLRGRKVAPSKGDRMEFARIARAPGSGVEVDVAYYMAQYVAGLCARFVNSEPEFAAAGAEAAARGDETRADELAQKAAKKSLEDFIRGLGGLDAPTMRRRGLAYRRAYGAAAKEACAAATARLGPIAAATLHGDWVNYETLLGGATNTVDALWSAAVDAVQERPESSHVTALAAALGIGPDGRDADQSTSANLFRSVAAAKSNVARAASSALDRIEAVTRAELGALAPAAEALALRHEAELTRRVQERRASEHVSHPEIGNAPAGGGAAASAAPPAPPAAPPADAAPAAAAADADRALLLRVRSLWCRAVAVQIARSRAAAFAAHLTRLRERRTGGVAAPPKAIRAAAVAAAAAAYVPLGGIAI